MEGEAEHRHAAWHAHNGRVESFACNKQLKQRKKINISPFKRCHVGRWGRRGSAPWLKCQSAPVEIWIISVSCSLRAAAIHASLLMIALTFTLACPQEAALELHNRSSSCDSIPMLRVNNVGSSADPESVITLRVVFQVNQGKNEKYKEAFVMTCFWGGGGVVGDRKRGKEMWKG